MGIARQDDVDHGGSFGQRLRTLRNRAGLTQEELAFRAGLTANGISALERGTRTRPYPHTVRTLADALGLSAAQREDLMAALPTRGGEATRDVDRIVAPSLPTPATPLLGRKIETAELATLLRRDEVRLITLTGPGGVGKTRLLIEAARNATFPDGIAFVGLAPLSDPAVIMSAVAATIGVREGEGVDPATAVLTFLRPRRFLLALDNFEHLIDAAPTVAELISACPGLTVLVSSRAPLRVRGETEFPVPPLSLPKWTGPVRPADVTASSAGRLFLDRARAVSSSFTLTKHNAAQVAAVCRRLGGLPLALELAAPKIKLLDPQTLSERLEDALSVGGARDLPARQQTMQSTIDWSYRLLADPERDFFVRLSVFCGGFSLAAAEVVVGMAHTLELLDSLVEQSLVLVGKDRGGRTYYSLLEPIRQFARALLRERGEEPALSRAHADYFLALAERAAPEFQGAAQVQWMEQTEWQTDNLRAAMTWALSVGDGTTVARLGWALWLFWWVRGNLQEGLRHTLAALRYDLAPPVRTRALLVSAAMNYALGHYEPAGQYWQQALENAERDGDLAGQAYGRAGVGLVAMARSETQLATTRLREAIVLADQVGDEWMISLGNIWLGTILLTSGDAKGATPLFERGLASARARGDHLVTYVALFNLAQAARARGDHTAAAGLLRESIALSQETRDRANLAYALDALAMLDAQRSRTDSAALLFGAAEAMREAMGAVVYHYYLPDEALLSQVIAEVKQSLGEPAFGDAYRRGLNLDLDEAVTYALARS